MGPLKLGSTKSTKRKKSSSKAVQATKRPKTNATTTRKSTQKGIERDFVGVVPVEELEVSDDAMDNFEEYKDFDRFLHNLDPQALAKKPRRQKFDREEQSAIRSDVPSNTDRNKVISNDVASENNADGQVAPRFDSQTDSAAEPGPRNRASPVHIGRTNSSRDYDNTLRSFKGSQDAGPGRLPIKMSDGTILQVQAIAERPQDEQTSDVIHTNKTAKVMIDADPDTLLSTGTIVQTQERLAKLAMEIIEDPEEHIDKLGKIKEILSSNLPIERRYAIMTLSAVFKDIIPGYRIRPLTALEKAEHTTKDVRRLRHFEQTLYTQYQEYVASLVNFVKTPRNKQTRNDIYKDIAIAAACALISAVPHFNFRTELLGIIVNQVCRRTVDSSFLKCRTTLETLLEEDAEGEASLDTLRVLCKRMKDREYQVDESTIEIFLHAKLLSSMESRGSNTKIDHTKVKKKERQFRTKKLKKLIKDQKEVDRDMREAEAVVSSETRERLQGDMLKLVFTTYFRMLQTRNRSTMGASLEGLAKFAHLINVDFFGDLLEVLKELLTSFTDQGDLLTTREALLCIVTAFSLLSGQGSTKETISLDLSAFTSKLYSILITIAFNANIELAAKAQELADHESRGTTASSKVNVSTEAEMLLRALDAVFFQQRAQGQAKLAAFVKRLSISALNFPEKSCGTSLELIRRLVIRYTKLTSLYSTEESAGDGRYDGQTDKLELSNHAATSSFELALYRKHYSPRVVGFTEVLSRNLQEVNSAVR